MRQVSIDDLPGELESDLDEQLHPRPRAAPAERLERLTARFLVEALERALGDLAPALPGDSRELEVHELDHGVKRVALDQLVEHLTGSLRLNHAAPARSRGLGLTSPSQAGEETVQHNFLEDPRVAVGRLEEILRRGGELVLSGLQDAQDQLRLDLGLPRVTDHLDEHPRGCDIVLPQVGQPPRLGEGGLHGIADEVLAQAREADAARLDHLGPQGLIGVLRLRELHRPVVGRAESVVLGHQPVDRRSQSRNVTACLQGHGPEVVGPDSGPTVLAHLVDDREEPRGPLREVRDEGHGEGLARVPGAPADGSEQEPSDVGDGALAEPGGERDRVLDHGVAGGGDERPHGAPGSVLEVPLGGASTGLEALGQQHERHLLLGCDLEGRAAQALDLRGEAGPPPPADGQEDRGDLRGAILEVGLGALDGLPREFHAAPLRGQDVHEDPTPIELGSAGLRVPIEAVDDHEGEVCLALAHEQVRQLEVGGGGGLDRVQLPYDLRDRGGSAQL